MPINVAIEAAEALGQAGDPRFLPQNAERNWVEIPAGKFLMGSQKDDPMKSNYDPQAQDRECPPVEVFLDAYRIGRYPVTVAEYERFVQADGYKKEEFWTAGGFGQYRERPALWESQRLHPNQPVNRVSWHEAMAYAAWLGCRLPTEAEWERAARGKDGRKYPWGDEPPNPAILNCEFNVKHAAPVGVYPRGATPEGIQDMAGNVWEWCYDALEGKLPGGENPCVEESEGPSPRMIRGGCWNSSASCCRAAYRNGLGPGSHGDFLGFRLAAVQSSRQAQP